LSAQNIAKGPICENKSTRTTKKIIAKLICY